MPALKKLPAAWALGALVSMPVCVSSQDAGSVLFVRGADRSGGFLENPTDTSRTEQLGDIRNTSTSGGNHGWFELAMFLETNGFLVEQVVEPLEAGQLPTANGGTGATTGAALDFTSFFSVTDRLDNDPGVARTLADYDVVVFGSNNADYSNQSASASVDAVEAYVRGGNAALFISDANFGSDWADASLSDQPFLDRFAVTVNQDNGTYTLSSAEDLGSPADYSQSGNTAIGDAVLGGVNAIEGEGVTPFTLGSPQALAAADVELVLTIDAEETVIPNSGFGGSNRRGSPGRAAGSGGNDDVAVFIGLAGAGAVAGHFDRNTFFNENGAGSFLFKEDTERDGVEVDLDNDEYALNLFTTLAAVPEPSGLLLLGVSAAAVLPRRRRG
ncbi:MAG: PEP-CTERM sorting domain-containing protein [Planctomycetota bacterium]